MQTIAREDSVADHPAFVPKSEEKGRKKAEKDKHKTQKSVKEKSVHPKKKSQPKKLGNEFFEELTESETAFFQTVKKVKKNLSSREEGRRALSTRFSLAPFKICIPASFET